MSKKTDVENEVNEVVVEATVESVVEAKPEAKVVEINGVAVNFGVRANVKSIYTPETRSLTFYVSNGTAKTLNVTELTEAVKEQAVISGLEAKVKSSLSGIKELADISAEIDRQVNSIVAGNFFLRAPASNKVDELSIDLLAYARAKSKQEAFTHWVDITNPAIVTEVKETWSKLETKVKNQILKNSNVLAAKLAILAEQGVVSKDDF
jgi:hypothetical protein